jgi:hypothetical protein
VPCLPALRTKVWSPCLGWKRRYSSEMSGANCKLTCHHSQEDQTVKPVVAFRKLESFWYKRRKCWGTVPIWYRFLGKNSSSSVWYLSNVVYWNTRDFLVSSWLHEFVIFFIIHACLYEILETQISWRFGMLCFEMLVPSGILAPALRNTCQIIQSHFAHMSAPPNARSGRAPHSFSTSAQPRRSIKLPRPHKYVYSIIPAKLLDKFDEVLAMLCSASHVSQLAPCSATYRFAARGLVFVFVRLCGVYLHCFLVSSDHPQHFLKVERSMIDTLHGGEFFLRSCQLCI